MAEYIAIPKLGMSMTEATLVEWKAKEGDRVEKGDVVLVIETEKTQWEVEAPASGLVRVLVPEEEVAAVSRVVGMVAESAEELEQLQKEPDREIFTVSAGPDGGPPPGVAEAPAVVESAPPPPARRPGGRIRVSPVARRMAEEHMIDVSAIVGTGPGGRIVREDVQKAIDAAGAGAAGAGAGGEAPPAAAPALAGGAKRVKSTIPLKSMRKTIAEHMQRSLAVSAQLTAMGEIDMGEVKNLRQTLVRQEEKVGTRITYTDIIVLALAKVLPEFPIINSSLVGNEIMLWEDINIGVAVALGDGLDAGLIVPVVRAVETKSLLEINIEIKELAGRARSGRLMPDEVSDGTFTLTNLGAFGGGYGFGTPIINQPQSAILGTGPITDRAVVRDGEIAVRPIMTYSFTFDHRVIDGAPATVFMLRLIEVLENPGLLLLL